MLKCSWLCAKSSFFFFVLEQSENRRELCRIRARTSKQQQRQYEKTLHGFRLTWVIIAKWAASQPARDANVLPTGSRWSHCGNGRLQCLLSCCLVQLIREACASLHVSQPSCKIWQLCHYIWHTHRGELLLHRDELIKDFLLRTKNI